MWLQSEARAAWRPGSPRPPSAAVGEFVWGCRCGGVGVHTQRTQGTKCGVPALSLSSCVLPTALAVRAAAAALRLVRVLELGAGPGPRNRRSSCVLSGLSGRRRSHCSPRQPQAQRFLLSLQVPGSRPGPHLPGLLSCLELVTKAAHHPPSSLSLGSGVPGRGLTSPVSPGSRSWGPRWTRSVMA